MQLTVDAATLQITGVGLGFGLIAGYSVEQMLGRPLGDLFTPDSQLAIAAGMRELLRAETPAVLDIDIVQRDGLRATAHLGLMAVRRDDGSVGPDQIALSLLDAAPRDGPQTLRDALDAGKQELDGLARAVSHDLRAPLRSIDGFARILAERHGTALPEEGRRYLGIVRDGTQRMDRLINELLALMRLGRIEIRRQAIDPAEVVRAALADLGDAARREGLEIRITAMPPCVADRALLTQVFANLLSNAVKFSRLRSLAEIETGGSDSAGVPTYFVRDNGVGFDMRYAHRLFQPFQRLHRDVDYEGTGIGLALAARIVQRHGGRIWAESKPDQGATFHFTLGGADG